jgi:hypothetical protein
MTSGECGERHPPAGCFKSIYVLKKQSEIPFKSLDPLDWKTLESKPDAKIVRIIHAMDLTADMKRQFRRRRR